MDEKQIKRFDDKLEQYKSFINLRLSAIDIKNTVDNFLESANKFLQD